MPSDLNGLFNPKSVAIIGASRDHRKIGFRALKLLLDHGYQGKIYPVNPNADQILGMRSYKSLKEIDGEVDLAIISVPSRAVLDVIKECVDKRVKFTIIFSAGFSETDSVGKELEERLVQFAREANLKIIGPNCLGIVDTHTGLCASFGSAMERKFKKGSISFLTQSGAFGGALFVWAQERGIGFSKFISSGNEADLDCTDFLNYLKDDPYTEVIVIYMEGVDDGQKLFNTLKEVTSKKPVVVLKVGRSTAGKRAALSHTGSIAGSDEVYTGVFKQTGAIRAWDVEELFDAALALAYQPVLNGKRIGIITTAGGLGVEAADACEVIGLEVPLLSQDTRNALRTILPPFASVDNPVDTTAQIASNLNWMEDITRLVLNDRNVDGLLITFSARSEKILAECILRVSREGRRKPILVSWTYGKEADPCIRYLMENGIPVYPTPERAAKAMSALLYYGNYLKKQKYLGKIS